MYEVIGRGVAVIRRRKGWTQEQTARAFRARGLTTWRTSTVGSLEAGMRRPGIGDVLLMCAALGTTLDDLIDAADEDGERTVELAPGIAITTQAVRDRLRPGSEASRIVPPGAVDPTPTEAEQRAARQFGTSVAEVRRAAVELWSRAFDDERDARIGDNAAPRTRQAMRGHATRRMLAELGAHIARDAALGLYGEG